MTSLQKALGTDGFTGRFAQTLNKEISRHKYQSLVRNMWSISQFIKQIQPYHDPKIYQKEQQTESQISLATKTKCVSSYLSRP